MPHGFEIVQLSNDYCDGSYKLARRTNMGWDVYRLSLPDKKVEYCATSGMSIDDDGVQFNTLNNDDKARIRETIEAYNNLPLKPKSTPKPKSTRRRMEDMMLLVYNKCMSAPHDKTRRTKFVAKLKTALDKGLQKGGILRRRGYANKCIQLLTKCMNDTNDMKFLRIRLASLLMSNFRKCPRQLAGDL